MTVFDGYARYYDLLYRDKDYAVEAEYVARLMSENANDVSALLELGCGTGLHAQHLARRGFDVLGIDQSVAMVERANRHRSRLDEAVKSRLRFRRADATTFSSSEVFDAVLALFHVMSYQFRTPDLKSFVRTASRHTRQGGLFILDFWYGPAVLTEHPETRVKRYEDDHVRLTRIAEPCMDTSQNAVDVHYELYVRSKSSQHCDVVNETHRMRYFFMPEIVEYLDAGGFSVVVSEEWLTGRRPGCDTWGVCVVGRQRG